MEGKSQRRRSREGRQTGGIMGRDGRREAEER
jgi:hypothetical protein